MKGDEGYQTRVVTAYAPCGSAASESETYYQQQTRYITEEALKTNPREMFREDLLTQLRKWRTRGNRMILTMNANGDAIDGAMRKQLNKADLNMKEVVFSQTRRKRPNNILQRISSDRRHMGDRRSGSDGSRKSALRPRARGPPPSGGEHNKNINTRCEQTQHQTNGGQAVKFQSQTNTTKLHC